MRTRNLAIIPARGGSKRLPGKNIKLLNGKPLIHYPLITAVNSKMFDRVVFSSDDENYLKIAAEIDGVTPVKRNDALASDTTKVWDLIHYIVSQEEIRASFDTVSLLMPTCPFRLPSDIQKAFEIFTDDCDSVISISEMRDAVQISVGFDNKSDFIDVNAVLNPSPLVAGNTRSQGFQKYYRPNGGIYISRIERFIQEKSFFTGRVKGITFDELKSVDIDTNLDFEWAEYLLKNGYINLEENE